METPENLATRGLIAEGVLAPGSQLDPKKVAATAMENGEYAPGLIANLAQREEYQRVIEILQEYAGKPTFGYCVQKLEAVLPGDVLMGFAASFQNGQQKQSIAGYSKEMRAYKKMTRQFNEYPKLLHITGEDLQSLQNGQLLVIGGGFSPIKKGLKDQQINCQVTNIDPLVDQTNPDNADRLVMADFLKWTPEKKYQEIWALQSLPTYAFYPQQVREFYSKALGALKTGGVLRIAPTEGFANAFTPAMRLTRKAVSEASKNYIQALRAKPDLFEVETFEQIDGKKTVKGAAIKVIGSPEK